jgi:peptidoglycan/LPS O-acetylase OafA/YrhL
MPSQRFEKSAMPRLPLLTSLRFLAALEVVIFHCGNEFIGLLASPAQMFFLHGYEAVSFFFVLSGFVLAYAYHSPSRRSSSVVHWSYYRARLIRIYPVYVLGLLLATPIFYWSSVVKQTTDPTVAVAALGLVPLLLQAWNPPTALAWNAPAWSLSVEAAFYAVFPWLSMTFFAHPGAARAAALVVLVCGTECIRIYLLACGATDAFVYFFPIFHAPTFLCGVAVAHLYLRHAPSTKVANLLFYGAATALVTLWTSTVPRSWASSNIVLVPLYSILILGATRCTGVFARVLSSRVLTILGDASYALYILHMPLHFWWGRLKLVMLPDPAYDAVWAIAFLPVVISVSVLTFFYLEDPIRRATRPACAVGRAEH